jgi:hypothetical protein
MFDTIDYITGFLNRGLAHVEEQSVLQVGEQESETVNDGQEVEFNAELLLHTGVHDAD